MVEIKLNTKELGSNIEAPGTIYNTGRVIYTKKDISARLDYLNNQIEYVLENLAVIDPQKQTETEYSLYDIQNLIILIKNKIK